MSATVEEIRDLDSTRFWGRIDMTGDCWVWTGSKTTGGYGNLRFRNKYYYAHRVAYMLRVGPIAQGMHLDHLCRNRACANPNHLEVVTPAENYRRGAGPYSGVRTECKNGHDITDPRNVYTEPGGHHRCRPCAAVITAQRTAARRAQGDKRKVRAPACGRGHQFDEANTYITPDGQRRCRKCSAMRARRAWKESR